MWLVMANGAHKVLSQISTSIYKPIASWQKLARSQTTILQRCDKFTLYILFGWDKFKKKSCNISSYSHHSLEHILPGTLCPSSWLSASNVNFDHWHVITLLSGFYNYNFQDVCFCWSSFSMISFSALQDPRINPKRVRERNQRLCMRRKDSLTQLLNSDSTSRFDFGKL